MVEVNADQCMMALKMKRKHGEEMPIMKPTKFLTNSYPIAERLAVRCDGRHEHIRPTGKALKRAGEYPTGLCDRICRGAVEEKHLRREPEMTICSIDNHEEYFIDDVYGGVLDPKKVRQARQEEMNYFREMNVCVKCPLRECYERTGRSPIKTRWVDTNKTNDEQTAKYRSRLLAREFRTDQRPDLYSGTPPVEIFRTDQRPDLYSGTPPVEMMRMIIAKVAEGQNDKGEME